MRRFRLSNAISHLSVSDTLTVTAQSFLNVSGSLEASGRIVLFAPMRIIVGATFSIAQRPSLVVYVTEAPVVSLLGNGSGTFTVPIATHSHRDGVFSNVTVLLTYPNARQSSQPCYTVGSAEPDYGSSSMSVTVAVDPCKSGDSGASGGNRSGLSDGAIVGIAVGVTAAGVLIAVLIGVMVSRQLMCAFISSLTVPLTGMARQKTQNSADEQGHSHGRSGSFVKVYKKNKTSLL